MRKCVCDDKLQMHVMIYVHCKCAFNDVYKYASDGVCKYRECLPVF